MRRAARGFLGLALLGLTAAACGKNNGSSEVPDRKVCQVNLAIAGMVCEDGCPIRVRSALAGVNGVMDVSVDYASNNVVVDAVFPACSRDGADQMVSALWQKGYTAKVTGSRAVVAWQ
jgi:copper chaperone CopZ